MDNTLIGLVWEEFENEREVDACEVITTSVILTKEESQPGSTLLLPTPDL